MTATHDARRASYAYVHRAELPGHNSPLDRTENAARSFDESRTAAARQEPATRASKMVAKDRPQPAPRPSPALALGPDRAVFNAAWDREGHEARRAAFKAKRAQEQAMGRGRKRSRQVAR